MVVSEFLRKYVCVRERERKKKPFVKRKKPSIKKGRKIKVLLPSKCTVI